MAKIVIKDLPEDMKVSDEELARITGGGGALGCAQPTMPLMRTPMTMRPTPMGSDIGLKLQIVTDRRTRTEQTLSNMVKPFSTAQETVTGNLK